MTVRGPVPRPAERPERDERAKLRSLEDRFEELLQRRRALLDDARRLSGEQKSLYDRRQSLQAEAEELHRRHNQLGQQLAEMRVARDQARTRFEEAVIQRREVQHALSPAERERPDHIRREVAELELRQQTHALAPEEEKKIVLRLKDRHEALRAAEARVEQVAAHAARQAEIEASVVAARAEVERIGEEMRRASEERGQAMVTLRDRLRAAGEMVAELRARGLARAEAMRAVDACSKELDAVNVEGRELLGRARERRAEEAKVVRQNQLRRRPAEEALASIAEEHLAELLKRGKVTL